MRANPLIHSSVMFRRAVVEAVGAYGESFAVAQDYDLWLRMSRVTRLANLREPLVLGGRRRTGSRARAPRRGCAPRSSPSCGRCAAAPQHRGRPSSWRSRWGH